MGHARGGGEPRQLTWYNDAGAMPPRGGTDYLVLGALDSRQPPHPGALQPHAVAERMGKYFLLSPAAAWKIVIRRRRIVLARRPQHLLHADRT